MRLALVGPSTLRGFRAWAIEECPVAPGRKAAAEDRSQPAVTAAQPLTMHLEESRPRRRPDGLPTKRDRLVSLASERHDLACMPLGEVSGLATVLALEIGYSAGTARRELIRHVRELQSGSGESVPPVREEGGDE